MTADLLLAALLMACVGSPDGGGKAASQSPAAPSLFDARRVAVRFPGGRTIAAEIADTPERVQHGYMFRSEVGESDGMIFVFAPAGEHPFWMKNTLVPLDIIWMDENRTIGAAGRTAILLAADGGADNAGRLVGILDVSDKAP